MNHQQPSPHCTHHCNLNISHTGPHEASILLGRLVAPEGCRFRINGGGTDQAGVLPLLDLLRPEQRGAPASHPPHRYTSVVYFTCCRVVSSNFFLVNKCVFLHGLAYREVWWRTCVGHNSTYDFHKNINIHDTGSSFWVLLCYDTSWMNQKP